MCLNKYKPNALVFVQLGDGGRIGAKITKATPHYIYWDAGNGMTGRAKRAAVSSQNEEMINGREDCEMAVFTLFGNLRAGRYDSTEFIDYAGNVCKHVGIGWISDRPATSEDFETLPLYND